MSYYASLFAPYIPRWVHPNQISILCHLLHYVEIGLGFHSLSLMAGSMERLVTVFTIAILNYLTMLLDCLDGIHARATNQCSTTGAILDHWFDAGNITFLSIACALVFRLPENVVLFNAPLGSLVFHCQLNYNYRAKQDVLVTGVESQIALSIAMILYGVIEYLQLNSIADTLMTIIMIIPPVVVLFEHSKLLPKYTFTMLYVHLYVISIIGGITLLRMYQIISYYEYFLFVLCIPWHMNGQLAIHYELKKNYDGILYTSLFWLMGLSTT
eukprot:UN25439